MHGRAQRVGSRQCGVVSWSPIPEQVQCSSFCGYDFGPFTSGRQRPAAGIPSVPTGSERLDRRSLRLSVDVGCVGRCGHGSGTMLLVGRQSLCRPTARD